MKHLNGNLLCAVDIETTGLEVGIHEIIEICVMPLDNMFKPALQPVLPFHQLLCPERVESIDMEAIRIHKLPDNNLDYSKFVKSIDKVNECVQRGMDKWRAADKFVEWFERLRLPAFKRICMLGHNLCGIDIPFIKEWLGAKSFEYCFSPLVRDTQCTALFMNDVSDRMGEAHFPFAKVNLQYVCTQTQTERTKSHNAFDDCVATAAAYSKMIDRTRV